MTSPTSLSDLVKAIRGWINVNNTSRLPDEVIISWVRLAEERINLELRIGAQLNTITVDLHNNTFPLPIDFNGIEYLRDIGGLPYEYITVDEYWRRVGGVAPGPLPNNVAVSVAARLFTVLGNQIMMYPVLASYDAAPQVEFAYYTTVSPLDDGDDGANEVFQASYRLYLFASLAMSAPYLDEDSRAALWDGEATNMITRLNDNFKSNKLGGGPLRPRRRSFG